MTDHCVILAGGLGTRLSKVTAGAKPKALVEIGGVPFLHFKLLSLVEMGFTSADILVGKQGDQIRQFVSKSSYPRIKIRCFSDGDMPLGTAGAIALIADYLPTTFWVTYADSYLVADVKHANQQFSNEEESVMTVLHNRDQIERSNVSVDEVRGHVTGYAKSPSVGTYEWIDFGILRLTRSAFSLVPKDRSVDLSEVIVNEIRNHRMRAFSTTEMFWDIGTPERLHSTTQEFLQRGWV